MKYPPDDLNAALFWKKNREQNKMKKSNVAEGIESSVFKLVAHLKRKGSGVIDVATQNMMRRAVVAYLENVSEERLAPGTDYLVTITGNYDELRINLCPLSEAGLAFFKKHRMCPANMQLAKVETVDVKGIVI